MAESLYPKLESELTGDVRMPTVNDLVESKLSKARATEIISKQRELEKELKHYKKLRHKWKKADNALRIVGITAGCALTAAGGIAAGVASAGVAVPILVPTVLAGVGVMETAITQSVAFSYIKKKKHRFSEKYDLVNTYLNRLYHLYHKSIEDKVISLQEMEEYRRLITDYEGDMSKLNTKDTGEDIHFSKLEHKADLEARAEYESELLQKIKDEKKKEYEQKFLRK